MGQTGPAGHHEGAPADGGARRRRPVCQRGESGLQAPGNPDVFGRLIHFNLFFALVNGAPDSDTRSHSEPDYNTLMSFMQLKIYVFVISSRNSTDHPPPGGDKKDTRFTYLPL